VKLSRLKSRLLSGDDRNPIIRFLLSRGWRRVDPPHIAFDISSQKPTWVHDSKQKAYTLLNAVKICERK
jgi:hypothetical protein